MFLRLFIVTTVLFVSLSACTPAAQSNSNEAIQNELQPILSAMLGDTLNDQIAVIQYTRTACATVEGLGGPPSCPDGVVEGTEVEVFPVLGSEGSFVKPEDMETFLDNSRVKSLYAIYRVTPNPNNEPYFPEGEYAMLFERDLNDILSPVILRVQDGKIVRMDFRMSISPEDIHKEIPAEQIVLTPQDAQAWMESIR
jgi:hypothetical protein